MPLLRRLAGGPGPAGSSPYSAAPPSSPCPCLSPGDTLLVVDCGGGTVDVTLHSVLGAGAEQRQQGPGGGPRLADAAVGRGEHLLLSSCMSWREVCRQLRHTCYIGSSAGSCGA